VNREPVTLEQLMQAVFVLAAIDPTLKNYPPTDRRRTERAYRFVRAYQEELEALVELEQKNEEARRAQERMMDQYDKREKTPYQEVEAAVCIPLTDTNKKLLWQAVGERANDDMSWAKAKQKGIPLSEIDSIRIRYDELKAEHKRLVNRRNAKKPRKKTKKTKNFLKA
jgi:xanthine dehydrogenase iron-sulfur cluster and FAD-binding subunit A